MLTRADFGAQTGRKVIVPLGDQRRPLSWSGSAPEWRAVVGRRDLLQNIERRRAGKLSRRAPNVTAEESGQGGETVEGRIGPVGRSFAPAGSSFPASVNALPGPRR